MSRIGRAGWGVVVLCFLLLCVRFIFASVSDGYPKNLPSLIFIVGGFALAWWRSRPAIFAFTAALFWINGLGHSFLGGGSPLELLFSSMFLGDHLHRTIRTLRRSRQIAGEKSRPPGNFPSVQLMAAAIMASLLREIWRHHGAPDFWMAFWTRPVFGFGDPFYFVTSAFLWLQGLFYFRKLSETSIEIAGWMRLIFACFAASLTVFFLFQFILGIPDPYNGYAYFLPCEDISSFGSVAVAVFIFELAIVRCTSWKGTTLQATVILLTSALVVASWSRAAWMSAALSATLVGCLRLPRRWGVAALATLAGAIVVINLNADNETWNSHPYLWRLVKLARIENPVNKDPTRLDLFIKAARMMEVSPLTGHGIGAFYLNSVKYARRDDSYGAKPDFAHNVILQIGAELGLPFAIFFAGWIGCVIWRGYASASPKNGGRRTNAGRLSVFGAALALAAYLLTQMSANSLNVYASNQFLFWFLLAAIAGAIRGTPGDNPPKVAAIPAG